MANPRFVVLAADADTTVTLDGNYGAIEVTLVSSAATTYFNTTGTAITSIVSPADGNHVLTTALLSKTVPDGTSGTASVVHLRSAGTPTVQVFAR